MPMIYRYSFFHFILYRQIFESSEISIPLPNSLIKTTEMKFKSFTFEMNNFNITQRNLESMKRENSIGAAN